MSSLRRTWVTARLDLLHNLRRPLFWIWVAIVVLMSWTYSVGSIRIESGDSSVGGIEAFITSEFAITQMLAIMTLIVHGFFVAIAAGMSILRDEELQVGSILHGTPLGPREYAWGKFFAVLVTCVGMLAAHVGFSMLFNHVLTGAAEASFIGPLESVNYWRPALVIGAPLVLFIAGVCFWVGTRFRSAVLVFFLPVGLLLMCLFVIWQFSPAWLPPAASEALALIDPAGVRWLSEEFLEVDRGVEFYNTASVPYEARFLASRAAFALIGLLGGWLAARAVTKSLRGRRVDFDARLLESAAEPRPALVPRPLGALGMRSKRLSGLGGLASVIRVELRELLSSPGLALFIPLIVLEAVSGTLILLGPFETTPLLTSGVLSVNAVTWLTTLVCLLLLFYNVESLRREQATGLAGLSSSTPVRTFVVLLGKALANALVGVIALLVTFAAMISILAHQGQVALDPVPFALVWGLILFPTFFLWSTFVGWVYSLVRGRYTTYAITLGVMYWWAYVYTEGDATWLNNWTLWGALQWSDMGTFELVRTELVMNRLLALTLAFAFTVLTVRSFPRRELDATNTLLRMRPLALLKRSPIPLLVLLPPLVIGIALHLRTQAGFQGDASEIAAKSYWRANVATWTDGKWPDLAGVDAHVDLFPDAGTFETRGTFVLRNTHDEPLRIVPITTGYSWWRPESLAPAEEVEEDGEEVEEGPLWTLNGEPFVPEDSSGLMLFGLAEPLSPEGELEIGFHFSGAVPGGATRNGGGSMEFITPGGVVLTSFNPTFVPTVGYNDGLGVDEDNEYDSKRFPDDHYEGLTRSLFGGGFTTYDVRLVVTAPEEYAINCIGVKLEDEVVDGRRRVVWETDQPVSFFNIVAGKWAVAEGELETKIFYHPEHTYNIDAMVEALDGSRRYYSEWFYDYPWKELKLSQFPALAGYAQGFATNITFSENIGFLTRADEDDADAPFMVTAHEAAHQWWGNILIPGEGPGGNLLSEGMAHFSTLLLFDRMRGDRGRIAFALNIENTYNENRVADSERPLVKIDGSRPGDQTVTYDKSGWVFWMLLNHMGRDNCLSGIRSFVDYYANDRDHPLLEDFLAHMRPYAPDAEAYDAFTQQWFFEVVVPEYELVDVQRVETDGGWRVSGKLENKGTGTMPVELVAQRGVRFPDGDEGENGEAESTDDGAAPEPYRASRTTVTLGGSETVEFEIQCDFEPAEVEVDPDARVLMLRRVKARFEF